MSSLFDGDGDGDDLAGDLDEAIGRPAPGVAGDEDAAPRYPVPSRYLAAVEIPAVVENIDRAVKAFGRAPSLTHALDPARSSLPLYLNPESPFCPPIMSHNAKSHNVVLKVTVPRRTGRKRKRGTDGPWKGDIDIGDADAAHVGASASTVAHSTSQGNVCSIARLDDPKILRRKLADNVDKYQVEAVGTIKHTHRFRGLADFYWDMSKSSFSQRYTQQVLPGDVQQIKNFKFVPGTDVGPNVDTIPPPLFTHMSLPFNYNYSQNPYVRTTEDGDTINTTAVKQIGYFIGAEDPAPTGPQVPPDVTDPRTMQVIAQLEEAFQDRPVWTRRSLLNHLGGKLRNWNELKRYLNYTAYQFKGGPWRDGVVPYGLDPRTDPKYRIYQTLMFKLSKRKIAHQEQTWAALRRSQASLNKDYAVDQSQSHTFDGESYHTDGKVWQVCDITDPLLRELLDNADVRPTWDVNSGWYHGGLWAKVKAIMKTKLVAIQFGRHLTRADFAQTLDCGDRTPTKPASSTFHLPLPNLHLTNEELVVLRGREPPKKKSSGYNVRVREPGKSPSVVSEQPPSLYTHDSTAADEGRMGSEDDEMDSGSGVEDEDENEDEETYPERDIYGHHHERADETYPDRDVYGHHHERAHEDADGGYGEEDDVNIMGNTVYPELD